MRLAGSSVSGKYFRQLGQEFGSPRIPPYTLRTFPENLLNPRMDPCAYPELDRRAGLGVAGVNKMEDANDFHRQWWLDSFIGATPAGRTDLRTTSGGLSEAPQTTSEPQSQALAPFSSGEGSLKPTHAAQTSPDSDTSPSSAQSSAPMKLPAWLSVFPGSKDPVNTNAVGVADISYTAPASTDEVINFYREGLNKSGVAIHIGFNGVGTTIEASLNDESCVIRIADANAGTTVGVKCARKQIVRPTYAAAPVAPPPPLPPGVHRVEYAISGAAGVVGLTYRNASGGTEQNDVGLPASMSFYAASGQFVYLSAQNKTASGDVRRSLEGSPSMGGFRAGDFIDSVWHCKR